MKFFDTEFKRFLAAGAFNAISGYAMYLLLNLVLDYRVAYTTSYLIGVLLSYWVNTTFVFRSALSWKSFAAFPSVYLLQYFLGLVLLWLFVNQLDISEKIAPLLAVPITVPLTFLASRFIIKGRPHA